MPELPDVRCPACETVTQIVASRRDGALLDCGQAGCDGCGRLHHQPVPGSERVWLGCGCVVTGNTALADAVDAAFTTLRAACRRREDEHAGEHQPHHRPAPGQ